MADSLKDFGSLVREWRAKEGMTQEELAKRVGVSRVYLSQIEQGVATNVSLRLADKLRMTLGLQMPIRPHDEVVIDPSLREFADSYNLPDEDVKMLARVEYRGRRPKDSTQWRLLYDLIKAALNEDV